MAVYQQGALVRLTKDFEVIPGNNLLDSFDLRTIIHPPRLVEVGYSWNYAYCKRDCPYKKYSEGSRSFEYEGGGDSSGLTVLIEIIHGLFRAKINDRNSDTNDRVEEVIQMLNDGYFEYKPNL